MFLSGWAVSWLGPSAKFATPENQEFDLIVNMSGSPLPPTGGAAVREWQVPDPIVMDYEDHCGVRDQIERLVMNLILELRRLEKQESAAKVLPPKA